eukprot:m.69526 g.69526  ORF g.69526 m.69526 type:complete len:452 (+) comp35615_c0_seq1:97-1452(+)
MELKTKKRLTHFSVGLFFLMGGIEYAVIVPTLWPFLESLDANKSFYGLTFAAFCITGLFSGPVFGFVTDRMRRTKVVILVANLFEIGGNFLYMISNSKEAVLGGRLIAGIGMGAAASIMAQLAWTSTEAERTAVFSVAMAMRNLGLMLGPALNVFLRDFDFKLGPFVVNKFTASGMFMSAVWIVVEIVMFCCYFDLPSIHDDPDKTAPMEETVSADQAKKSKLDVVLDFLREEIIVLLAVQFMLLFNQCSMESLVVPISTKYFGWHELENSLFYSGAAVLGVTIFFLVRYLSKWVEDRWLIGIGMVCESIAIGMLLAYIPNLKVGVHTKLDVTMFIVGCGIVVFGLPFFTVGSASLFSKLIDMKYQGSSQGMRRIFINLGIIMGPLWAGAFLDRPYIMLGVMLGLQLLFLGMLVLSFKRLREPRFRKKASEDSEEKRLNDDSGEADPLLIN